MRYVRFESQITNAGTASRLGVFQLAFLVRDAVDTMPSARDEIVRNLEWLKVHLHSPEILRDPQHYRAICWFKDTAREPMKRIWAIKPFLENHGYWIDVVTSRNPGNLLYEDGWQIVATPWRSGTHTSVR